MNLQQFFLHKNDYEIGGIVLIMKAEQENFAVLEVIDLSFFYF